MTNATMALAELAEKGPDVYMLRQMVQFAAQRLMDMCQVPDDWLLHNRRALLFGREVLKAVMAAFTPGSQAA